MMQPGPAPLVRAENGGERRAEILRHASLLFDLRGYNGVSMGDLAAAVGIAKPTLYHYFRSKDEILFELHEEFINVLLIKHHARRSFRLTNSQQILEIMADILELMVTHRGHVRVFFDHYSELPPDKQLQIRGKRDQYHRLLEEMIRRGVASGEFRDVDVELAGLAIFGMCNWAYKWYRAEGRLSPRDVATHFWSLAMSGLMVNGPGGER
jgi:TetR/AcrR family transcriptional regulator, cholesterol catabolism regulator